MTSAADIITALNQRRTRFSNRPETPGQMPSGWQRWFDAMPAVDAHAPGALAPALVDVFAQRPLRAIPRAPKALTRLQSFGRLLQQEWTPNARDERGLRIGVGAVDILLHLVLVGMLLWLMYLRFMALMQAPPVPRRKAQARATSRAQGRHASGFAWLRVALFSAHAP